MALDYVKTSKEIIEALGGKDNILSASHCMTRLRLVLADESKANDNRVGSIKGVKSVIRQGSQYQIVIGNEVSNLFKEFQKLGDFSENIDVDRQVEGNLIQRLFGFVAGCMTPLLPAMLGTGMVKVLLTILTTFGIMSSTDSTYVLLFGMADSFFHLLPVFLGWSIAKNMNKSIPLFMVIGAMMCYPDIVNLMGSTLEGVKMGSFLGMPCTYFFGLPVILSSYTSSVLPMILMAPVMAWTEDFADRISPNVLKAFMKPMVFFLICLPILFVVLGPIGNVIGNAMAGIFTAMYSFSPWVTVGLLSAIMPFVIMTGMHYALIPLCLNNMATLGYDVIVMVTMFCSNIAQGGASLGVAAKTKDEELRSEGLACGISATIAGVTEPAMYGINLRFMKPMIAACIGAAISGLFVGIAGVKGWTMGGSPSFLSVITFIGGENPMNGLIFGLIGGFIAVVVSFMIAFMTYKDESQDEEVEEIEEAQEIKRPLVKKIEIVSPLKGKVVSLKEVPDAVFSSGALGEGVAILPEEGKVYAPISGMVSATMDTGHALGITSEDGAEILIHLGIDTVQMEGKPFKYYVKQGQKVSIGDLLFEADLKQIQEAGYPLYTPVVVTNATEFTSVKAIKKTNIDVGDQLLRMV